MNTILKLLFKPLNTCITFLSFLILTLIALILINPHSITTFIQHTLQKCILEQTDNTITLSEPLQWTLLPQITLTANNVLIHHPDEQHQALVAIPSISVQPNIWRLLLGDYSGTIETKVNDYISLESHATWSAPEKKLSCYDMILRCSPSLNTSFHLAGTLQINTETHTIDDQLQSTEPSHATLNIHAETPQQIHNKLTSYCQSTIQQLEDHSTEEKKSEAHVKTFENLFETH